MTTDRIQTYEEFWPFYLGEHSSRVSRILHIFGTSLGLICLCLLLITQKMFFLPLGFFCGYCFAWIGHFVFEKNRPATFRYPLWSLYSDFRMWFLTLTGKLPLPNP